MINSSIVNWICGIWSAGLILLAGILTIMICGSLLSVWRRDYRERRRKFFTSEGSEEHRGTDSSCASCLRGSTKEYSMKSRITLAAIMMACAVIVLLQPGCSTFGNGKIDPGGVELVDLTGIDIDVEWVSADGRTFKVTQTGNGIDVVAEFVEPKTGLVFVLGEGIGTFTIRDPATGLQTTIHPKTNSESSSDS